MGTRADSCAAVGLTPSLVLLPSQAEFKRLISTVEKLDGCEPQVTVADIFEIVNRVFTTAIDIMTRVARHVGRLCNVPILHMQPRATRCDSGPEIIQHVSMKSDPLTRSQPNFPDANAIGFRQKPRANSTVELICHELLAGLGRRGLLGHTSGHPTVLLDAELAIEALSETESGLRVYMLPAETNEAFSSQARALGVAVHTPWRRLGSPNAA